MERGKGTIVNVSSIGGKVPLAYRLPYTTSKYAVTGLTEALHSKLSPKGIQVCGIYPNLIKSSFLERAVFRGHGDRDLQARRNQVEKSLSIPVVEKPEDVAQAIWNAVKHQKAEVLVGSASLSKASQQGVQAIQIIAPNLSIPIHFNDYTVFKSPLEDFMQAVTEAGLDGRVRYLSHGETYSFESDLTQAEVLKIGDRMLLGKTFDTAVTELNLAQQVSPNLSVMITIIDKQTVVDAYNSSSET